jgi:hypothetical protein
MSDSYFTNDDLMQNIDSVGDDTTTIKDDIKYIKDLVSNFAKENIKLKSEINKLQINQDYLISIFKIVNGLDKKAS